MTDLTLSPEAVAPFFKVEPTSVHYLVTEDGHLVRLAFISPRPPMTRRPCCTAHEDGDAWRFVMCPTCFHDLLQEITS